MSYPVAAGKTNIGASTMQYIPAIYSGKLLVNYLKKTVLGAIVNRDYEGEIKKAGDTVYIRSDPDITIRDYVKGQALVNEQPESTSQTLLIDKGHYWSFVTEDLDDRQTDIKSYISRWAARGAYALEVKLDTNVLDALPALVHASNTGATAGAVSSAFSIGTSGSPVTLTKANIIDYFADLESILDEQDAPSEGRYCLLSPRAIGLIRKSDLKDCSLTGDPKSIIRTGYIGEINGFTVYKSNLLKRNGATSTAALFGVRGAVTFATQLVESKVQDNPDGFGKLHRHLNVYGYKVIKSEGIGCMYYTV
jgi:hypothetical protein